MGDAPTGTERRRGAAPDAPPVTEESGRPTATIRIGGRDPWPLWIGGLIAVFLVLAVAKPWVIGEPAGFRAATPSAAVVTVAPSLGPDPLAALREHCQEPLGWRVYSREAWNGRTVRTWSSVEPAHLATGPRDFTIPSLPLGPAVEALGYCSPWVGVERVPAAATVAAWRVDPTARSGITALTLRAVAPVPPSPLGALYGPIGDRRDPASPGATGWPAGRYVFEIGAPGWTRWWAVEIGVPDALGPISSRAVNP